MLWYSYVPRYFRYLNYLMNNSHKNNFSIYPATPILFLIYRACSSVVYLTPADRVMCTAIVLNPCVIIIGSNNGNNDFAILLNNVRVLLLIHGGKNVYRPQYCGKFYPLLKIKIHTIGFIRIEINVGLRFTRTFLMKTFFF